MVRKGIERGERKALRTWFFSQQPRPSHKECITWFEGKFKRQLRQSTISESLSDRFTYLDSPSTVPDSYRRARTSNWPILEQILFEWQQSIEQQGGLLTGDLLIAKAREIWPQIPQYYGQPVPSFSTGWLAKFKDRHQIKQQQRHGEAGSVPAYASEEMKAVRTICGEYEEENIYNMDETGLFWRRTLSSGLGTYTAPGIRKSKSRISIVACTNATGTDRLPLLIIGNAARPRALRTVNIQALGAIWRSNKKAWMTTELMKEWLYNFYRHIGSRTALLLMDNFSAHLTAVSITPPPTNIRIQYLPKNSTSLYQPLDQGIIQNFKQYYRKQWLEFQVQQYDQGLNPLQAVTLYHALRWSVRAWQFEVTNSTIYACFRKSSIIPPSIQLPTEPPVNLELLYETAATRIHDAMSLSNFLNPTDEDLYDDNPSIEEIITRNTQEDEEDEDEEQPQQPVPSSYEAVQALQLLLRYKEHQEDAQASEIRSLVQIERALLQAIQDQRPQGTLDGWLM